MLFQNYKNKTFNSIELRFFKERMGLSARQYAYCIGDTDDLYVIGGDEDINKCKSKAQHFADKYKVAVDVYYFARESEDEWIQRKVCSIMYASKPHKKKKDRHTEIENPNDEFSTVSKFSKPSVIVIDDKKDQTVLDAQNNYLNYLNNKVK